MKIENVDPKLKPKESTSNFYGNDWEEERLCMALRFKIVFSISGICNQRCLVGRGEFWEKFIQAGFKVALFEMWLCCLPMGCFDSCLEDKDNGRMIKTRSIRRV